MTALFLADLHLPNKPSPLREGFVRFCAGPARAADSVYLLGDIFEYWVGDDVGVGVYAAEIHALRALSGHGVEVYVQCGNRDFLLGPAFERASGASILKDPALIALDGQRVLISHGDAWCTDDTGYQRWRRFAHNKWAQWFFLHLPKRLRIKIAGGLRQQSGRIKQQHSAAIMDVNPDAIGAAFARADADWIIHGHTHRPDTHVHHVENRARTRFVLADWHADHMEYLCVDEGQVTRERV